jgi:uncharacterized protein YidB (DUF937 family)
MDFNDLFKMGAELIQNNSDDATTSLDADSISNAIGGLLQGSDGNLDLSGIMSSLADSNLGEVVNSWLGNGENMPIDADQITQLLGSDKVEEFASSLGLSFESASQALSDALPQVIDKATSGEDNIVSQMLEQVGGVDGAMDMFKKMFG